MFHAIDGVTVLDEVETLSTNGGLPEGNGHGCCFVRELLCDLFCCGPREVKTPA